MKKILLIITLALFLFSCGPKRFCGGAGGKRCVEIEKEKPSIINTNLLNNEILINS